MTKKLYNNGYIKLDLIEKALKEAKRKGNLPSVPTSDIKYFIKSFEDELEKFKLKVGTKINQNEMKFLFKQLMLNRRDKITDKELNIIEKILLDKKLQVR